MKNSIVIGLTGQTGSGKSTVCRFAEEYGAAVIDADKAAREVMSAGSPCLEKIAECFGSDVIAQDGSLVRSLLAQRAFSSRENTDLLNSIAHPFIISKTKEYISILANKYDMILFDAPQLFESGGDKLCCKIITVTAPDEIRLGRIMQRDNITEDAARLRMSAQHELSYYTDRSDYVIDGSQTLEQLKKDVFVCLERCKNGRRQQYGQQ